MSFNATTRFSCSFRYKGDMLLMEVCDDCMILRSVKGEKSNHIEKS